MGKTYILNWVFGLIRSKEIFWSVDIMAETEIVDLSNISLVEVLSNEDLEELLAWWEDIALLQNSSKLLGSNMAALGLIIVLQLRLNQDSLVLNLVSH